MFYVVDEKSKCEKTVPIGENAVIGQKQIEQLLGFLYIDESYFFESAKQIKQQRLQDAEKSKKPQVTSEYKKQEAKQSIGKVTIPLSKFFDAAAKIPTKKAIPLGRFFGKEKFTRAKAPQDSVVKTEFSSFIQNLQLHGYEVKFSIREAHKEISKDFLRRLLGNKAKVEPLITSGGKIDTKLRISQAGGID